MILELRITWHRNFKSQIKFKNQKEMKNIIVCLIVLPILFTAAHSQKPEVMISDKAGWHKIGSVTASFKMEKEEILVLGADKFKAIRLKVIEAPMHIAKLEVYFESGEKEVLSLGSDLKAGEETRVIDLKSKDEALKKVVFVYKTEPNVNDEKATVELYGLK